MKKNKTAWLLLFIFGLLGLMVYLAQRRLSGFRLRSSSTVEGNAYGGLAPGPAPSHAALRSGNPVRAFIAAYQTPIEFYGKVVDQHGEPVAGAAVKILPFDNAFGNSDTQMLLTSDAGGLFSVKGLKGLAIGVMVEKNGYLTLPDLGLEKPASAHRIEYGLDDTQGARFKDPNKPTLFTLHQIGPLEPMAYIPHKRWSLPVDGSPRNIALDAEDGLGTHQIEFRFTSDWSKLPDEPGVNYKQFDWKLEASVPGGGFCKYVGDYAFDAPETGYQEKITINYPADMTDQQWKRMAFRRCFVKFADGTCARIRFGIQGNTDRNPLSMSSWMNRKPGSRNLASDQKDDYGMPEE